MSLFASSVTRQIQRSSAFNSRFIRSTSVAQRSYFYRSLNATLPTRTNILEVNRGNAVASFVSNNFSQRYLTIVKITEENYKDVLSTSSMPTVLKFEADWCQPCKDFAPILEESLKAHGKDKLQLVLVNVDLPVGQSLAAELQVKAIPNVAVINAGTVISQFEGAVPRDHLDAWIQNVVKYLENPEAFEKSVQDKDEKTN